MYPCFSASAVPLRLFFYTTLLRRPKLREENNCQSRVLSPTKLISWYRGEAMPAL
jgi:hypothetical protein